MQRGSGPAIRHARMGRRLEPPARRERRRRGGVRHLPDPRGGVDHGHAASGGGGPDLRCGVPGAARAGRAGDAAGAPGPHAAADSARERGLPARGRRRAGGLGQPGPLLRHRGAGHAAGAGGPRPRQAGRQARRSAPARHAHRAGPLRRGPRGGDRGARAGAGSARGPQRAHGVGGGAAGARRPHRGEIARTLGVSRKTVGQDWRLAAMWLRAEIAGDQPP